MGNYMLCKGPLARTPYYIESIQVNLYSMEELCYFLSNNLPLADPSVLNPSLALWLSRECGLTEEGRRLESILSEEGREKEGLKWIFKSSHYFTLTQLQKLNEKIDEFDQRSEHEQMKARADALMNHGKIRQALRSYEEIRRMTGITATPKNFQSSIWYNLGCAYARLFQIKKAGECFERAYDLFPDERGEEALLYAAYLDGGRESFEAMAGELKSDSLKTDRMLSEIASISDPLLPEDLSQAVHDWISEYHRMTGL